MTHARRWDEMKLVNLQKGNWKEDIGKILLVPRKRHWNCQSRENRRRRRRRKEKDEKEKKKIKRRRKEETNEAGCVILQAISRRLPAAVSWVQSRVSQFQVCGGRSGTEAYFSEQFDFPCQSSFHRFFTLICHSSWGVRSVQPFSTLHIRHFTTKHSLGWIQGKSRGVVDLRRL